MKSNRVHSNNENVVIWTNEVKYLIDTFSSSIEQLGLVLTEIGGNQTKFKGINGTITFNYSFNRYGGRTLEDIEMYKSGETYLLSDLVYKNEELKRLSRIVGNNSKNNITPMETYKNLFDKYLKDLATLPS